MKNIFELSEEEKNKIRGLHESYKSKPGTKLIWEQTEDVTLDQLNNKIKTVLLNNKNKFYQDVTVTISPYVDNGVIKSMILEFKSQTNPTEIKTIDVPASETEGLFEKNGVAFNKTFNTLKLSDVYEQIWKDEPNLKQLYDTNTNVKSQMDSAFVPLYIYTENSNISITSIENIRRNRKGKSFVYGDTVTLDTFYNAAGTDFAVAKDTIYSVGFGGLVSDLGKVIINKTSPGPTPTPPPVIPDYEFTLTDVFNFDTIDLKDPTKLDEEIEKLQRFMLRAVDKGKFLDVLNTDVVIKGYASSDGNPSEKVTGKYGPCSDSDTRGNYDKCLSQKRAEFIANKLNDAIKTIPFTLYGKPSTLGAVYSDSTSNWARAEGMGQDSSQSKIDWRTEHDPSETAADRRIVFTPKLTIKV